MSFANMNPADRMKASGMIGLIVVILFFVVHTFLGAVAPKRTSVANPITGSMSGVATPPVPSNGPNSAGTATSGTPDGGFPTDKIPSAKSGSLAKNLEKEIPDPFVPINPKDRANQQAGAARQPDSPVEVRPAFNANRPVGPVPPDSLPYGPSLLPPLGAGPGLTRSGQPGPFGPAPVTVFRVEPEIKVVGLVDGDPPIATMQVAGRTTLAHRGDALATGYRVVDITADGVVIRCWKERKTLRVGGVVNEKTDAKAEAH